MSGFCSFSENSEPTFSSSVTCCFSSRPGARACRRKVSMSAAQRRSRSYSPAKSDSASASSGDVSSTRFQMAMASRASPSRSAASLAISPSFAPLLVRRLQPLAAPCAPSRAARATSDACRRCRAACRRCRRRAGSMRVQLFERLDRLVVVGELLDPQPGDTPQKTRLFRRVGRDVDGALQDADEIVPATERLVLARQRRQRVAMVRLQRQDMVEGVDDHDVEVELVAVDRDHLHEAPDASVDVILRQRLDALFQQLEQRVPLLGLLIEPLERVDGVRLRRIDLEHALP